MAKDIGLSRPTVIARLKELEAAGYLEVVRKHNVANVYKLGGVNGVDPGVNGVDPGVNGVDPGVNALYQRSKGALPELEPINKNQGTRKTVSPSSKPKRKPKAEITEVPFPPHLDTPEFRTAWAEWCEERRQRRKPMTSRAAKKQFEKLSDWTPAQAIEAINNAITAGWSSLWPPSPASQKTQPARTKEDLVAEQVRLRREQTAKDAGKGPPPKRES